MPAPSASQFTQLQKFNAIAARQPDGKSQQKTYTAMYQPVPSVPNPTNFLASPGTKFTSTRSFIPINRVTGIQYKPKVPAGFGNPGAGLIFPIAVVVPSSRFVLSNLVTPPYLSGGYTPPGSGNSLVGNLYNYILTAPATPNYFPDTVPTGGNSIGTITTPITTSNVNPLSYLILRFSASNFPNELFRLYPTSAGGMIMYVGRKNTTLTLDDVVSVMNDSIGQPSTSSPNIASQEILGTGAGASNSSYLISDFNSPSDFADIVLINHTYLAFYFQLDVLRNPRADITWTWPITQFAASPIILPTTPTGGPFNIMVIRFINPMVGMNYTIAVTPDSFSGGFQSITFDGDLIERITGFNSSTITFKTIFTPTPSTNVQTITLVFANADNFPDTSSVTSITSFI